MTSKQSTFKNSIDGVLNHDGSVKIAEKFDVMQTVVFCDRKNEIHLQNKAGNKYRANKHYKLDLTFCEVGDTAFVKFNCNKPYVIGFRKELKK